jgi:thiol-disulfide isomerase/thioredoxin
MATTKMRKHILHSAAGKRTVRNKAKSYKRVIAGKQTVRRHKTRSTAGKILPPLDVRSKNHLKDFEKRIKSGPLTIVLVYADWCGHCHTMMPHFDAASKSPQRSIQSVKVNEQMLDSVNDYMNKNNNSSPISVSGYPSILIVDDKGEKVTDMEAVRDTKVMTQVMNKSASMAKNSGLLNKSNVGVENSGMAALNARKNANVGEEELKGSLTNELRMNANSASSMKNKNNMERNINEGKAPSMSKAAVELNNYGNSRNSQKKNINSAIPKDVEKEASLLTSMSAPIEPVKNEYRLDDMIKDDTVDLVTPPTTQDDIANRMAGGSRRRRGGTLLSALSRATYTLAPAAAILATAAIVTRKASHKKRKSTHKKIRKQRK